MKLIDPQTWKPDLSEFEEKTKAFYAGELNKSAYKSFSGYYGSYAVHRNMPYEQVKACIEAGMPVVLRFRSEGDPARRVKFTDLVKGTMEIPENDQVVVLLK